MLLANTNSGAIVDLIALLVIIGFALLGLKKGFTKTFVSMFGTLFSLLFAVLLCKSTVSFLESKYQMVTSVSNWTSGLVSRLFGGDITTLTLGQASEELLRSTSLSSWLIGLILSVKAQGTVDPTVTLDTIISPVLGYYIVLILALIVLYILFKVLFFLIGEIVKRAYNIKVIGILDTVLGVVIGIVHGIIILQLAIMVIHVIPMAFFQNLSLQIDNSVFASFINKVNVYRIIIKAMSSLNLTEIISSIVNK